MPGERLKWTCEGVYSLIAPFPPRGKLDKMVEFQDDEDVLAEGEVPWDMDEKGEEESLHGSGEEESEILEDDEELDEELEDAAQAA